MAGDAAWDLELTITGLGGTVSAVRVRLPSCFRPILWWVPAMGLAVSACQPGPSAPAALPQAPAARPQAPAARPPKPGTVTRMELSEFFQLQQSGAVLIYDARPGISHSLAHIPGSQSWPKGQFDRQLTAREVELKAATRAKRPVVIYCTDSACPDAATMAGKLAARGHSVAILDGGFEAWKAAELPVE